MDALQEGAEIEIEMHNSTIQGTFRSSDDAALVITANDRERSIEKLTVQRLYRVQRVGSNMTGTGLAAGLGVGLLDAVTMAPSEERNEGC